MKSKPAYNHRPIIRAKAREVLSILHDQSRPRASLMDLTMGVNKLLRNDIVANEKDASEVEVKSALGWLIDKHQAGVIRNETLDIDEYHITTTGRQAMRD